jgi:uncharacterized damage-inducible protein DinB
MAEFIEEDLKGSRFEQVNLAESRWSWVTLAGSQMNNVDLSGVEIRSANLVGTRLRDIELNGVVMRGAYVAGLDIHGEINKLTVNGVDVVPLINAELDRRHPDRVKMRPTDVAGFREAWDTVEQIWAGTVERARRLDPELLHESVGGEWSFIETLRHLSFATECWVKRALLGDPTPWHPLSLPWDEMPDTPGVPRDREVRPSLDEVLELRHDRMATVREFVDNLTEERLAGHTEPVEGPGWPEPRAYPVRECLLVTLNEEWEHRLYAERDLAVLES